MLTRTWSAALKIANRVQVDGRQTLPYALGRFYTVRRIYSVQQKLRRSYARPDGRTLFPDVDTSAAVESLKKMAVFRTVRLPREYVMQLKQFATTQPLATANGPAGFRYTDVVRGRLYDREPIVMAQVTGAGNHPAIKAVAEDPVALSV